MVSTKPLLLPVCFFSVPTETPLKPFTLGLMRVLSTTREAQQVSPFHCSQKLGNDEGAGIKYQPTWKITKPK